MKFRKSGSFTRFFVEGGPADPADVSLIKALARERFKPLEGATESDSTGWVTRTDPTGSRFPAEDVIHGPFLIFAMRTDRKRVSPALMKIEIATDLRAAATGLKPGQPMARAVKKQVIEEARRKLVARALPNVQITDCLWNCSRAELFIFATGASTVETAAHLFRETFDRTLKPATMTHIVESMKLPEPLRRAFREASPAPIAGRADRSPVAGETEAHAEAES
jgi:recombination associated protein RdgC